MSMKRNQETLTLLLVFLLFSSLLSACGQKPSSDTQSWTPPRISEFSNSGDQAVGDDDGVYDDVDVVVEDAGRTVVDLNFDGINDEIFFSCNEDGNGYIRVVFGGSEKVWEQSLVGDGYVNSLRALYRKLRVIAFKSASGVPFVHFMTAAGGNGGSENAFAGYTYCVIDDDLIEQVLEGDGGIMGEVSADGAYLTVQGTETGYEEHFTVLEGVPVDPGLGIWRDSFISADKAKSASGTGYDLVLGEYVYGAARANTIGTAYTRYAIDGGGTLTPIEQWFTPADPHLIVPYDGELPEEDSEFSADDTIEVDCLDGRLTLTLPGTWLDHFVIEEGVSSVSVYNRENREADMNTGLLFTVILSDYQSEKELEAAGYPDYRNLGKWEGGLVIAMLPSDVQFSDNDHTLADIYMSMSGDVEMVLNAITLYD